MAFSGANVVNLPGVFVSLAEYGRSYPLAPAWTHVDEQEQDHAVTDLLRLLVPEVESVRVGADEAGRAHLRIQHDRLGRIPIELLGAGFGKALAIACYVVKAKGGLLIIDEFDASLSVGVQTRLIEFVMKAARKHDVQLFISTHSLETVDMFLDYRESSGELWQDPAKFRVLQMRKKDNRIDVDNLDAERAKRLRDEIGLDLRQTV